MICCLTTNNELAAKRSNGVVGDNFSTEHQLFAMREMVEKGPGQGWMEIAESPEEARRIIAEDKLAVVLGVEVDSLGDWRTEADLPSNLVEVSTGNSRGTAAFVSQRRTADHAHPLHR